LKKNVEEHGDIGSVLIVIEMAASKISLEISADSAYNKSNRIPRTSPQKRDVSQWGTFL
jgi:hypothetical protein